MKMDMKATSFTERFPGCPLIHCVSLSKLWPSLGPPVLCHPDDHQGSSWPCSCSCSCSSSGKWRRGPPCSQCLSLGKPRQAWASPAGQPRPGTFLGVCRAPDFLEPGRERLGMGQARSPTEAATVLPTHTGGGRSRGCPRK